MNIHIILGLRAQERLLTNIRAEPLGYIPQWEMPNISIQRNNSNKELLLVGKIGVSSELFDTDGPTFHVHRFRIGQLKDECKKHALKKMVDTNLEMPDNLEKKLKLVL